MSNNQHDNDSPLAALKSESARQRWDMFHRAIAHAKESNNAALDESDAPAEDGKNAGPMLSIVR